MGLLIFPPPSTYAVIRMDPATMLKDLGLDDSEALAEVRAIAPKKYLVYLDWPEELPMPTSRWCRYDVMPIGTTLRRPDRVRGITRDMVIPIFPNKQHAQVRGGYVRPTPSFPFSNCYHWFRNNTPVRVRVRNEGHNKLDAISLSSREDSLLGERFQQAYRRMMATLEERRQSESTRRREFATSSVSATVPREHDRFKALIVSAMYRQIAEQRGLLTSIPSGSYGNEFGGDGHGSAQFDDDLFGWNCDYATALLPLVDAWLDIDKHLAQDEIPNPVDLEEEIRNTVEIIKRALLRHAVANGLVSEAELVSSGELAHLAVPLNRQEDTSNSGQHHSRVQSVIQGLDTPEALAPGDTSTTRPDKAGTLTDSNSLSISTPNTTLESRILGGPLSSRAASRPILLSMDTGALKRGNSPKRQQPPAMTVSHAGSKSDEEHDQWHVVANRRHKKGNRGATPASRRDDHRRPPRF